MSPFWWGMLHPFGPPRPWWSKERCAQWLHDHGTPWNTNRARVHTALGHHPTLQPPPNRNTA